MILHLVTFITLALGSVYEQTWLTFGSLISLALGLYFGKESLERLDAANFEDTIEPAEDDEEPPLGIG